jgi:hypothetical protein
VIGVALRALGLNNIEVSLGEQLIGLSRFDGRPRLDRVASVDLLDVASAGGRISI